VSRELGTPCVVGCGPGVIERLTGRRVTVDATAGVIYDGELTTTRETVVDPDVAALTRWAQAEAGEDRPLRELLARRRT
jgi:pyruvate,orthophosphate dikinase